MSKSGVHLLLLFVALCLVRVPAFADGGTLQFRKQAGPFTVTLFSAPVPLRAGAADLSVLVQDAEENTLVDGAVTLLLSKSDQPDIVAEATTARATNKLLYAARVDLPEAGKWRVQVRVNRGGSNAAVDGEISVLPEEAPLLTYWPYFAVVPIGLVLFVLNQWLKGKQRSTHS